MLFTIFKKMRSAVQQRVHHKELGLYILDPVYVVIFPIAIAFLFTFIGSRIMSHFWPWLYLPIAPGLRIHHFAYGFFVLAASGYLALVFNGPRAKYLISLFHGFGLGLAFDEFGMWLRLRDDDITRWSYDGLLVVVGLFFLLLTAKPGIKMVKKLWPFRRS